MLLLFSRVVLLKFNKIGTVILMLRTKKKNVFLLLSLIYYKVVVISCLRASTIGKMKTNVFLHILSSIASNRFAEKFHKNGIQYRTLTKIYGLRFVLSVKGEGRRFDTVNLFVAIGMCFSSVCLKKTSSLHERRFWHWLYDHSTSYMRIYFLDIS